MYNGVAKDCNISEFTAKSSLYGVLCANVHICGMSVCVCVCVCACREGGFELRSVKAFGRKVALILCVLQAGQRAGNPMGAT